SCPAALRSPSPRLHDIGLTMMTTDEHDGAGLNLLSLLELENNRRFGLIVHNTERVADSLDRIADALEALLALGNSVVGTGRVKDPNEGNPWNTKPCKYVRTGNGRFPFNREYDDASDDINLDDED